MCSQYCLMKDAEGEDGGCAAFHHNKDDGTCEVGVLGDGALLVDQEPGGVDVYTKPENDTVHPHVMTIAQDGKMVDVNLKDMTYTHPAITDLGVANPGWGQWYKKGFLVCSEAATRTCKQHSLAEGTWTTIEKIPIRHKTEPATVAILDEVWFIAGETTAQVDYYRDDSWHQAPDYPAGPTYHHSATTFGSTYILSCGGKTTAACYKIDAVAKDAWVAVADMPAPRYNFNLAAFRDSNGRTKVMAPTGRSDSESHMSSVSVYDVEADEWADMQDFPINVRGAAAIAYDNTVWVMGGNKSPGGYSKAVYRYNPGDDTWTEVGTFPNGMQEMQVMPFNHY